MKYIRPGRRSCLEQVADLLPKVCGFLDSRVLIPPADPRD
jgi:hypothetical protein